MALVAMTAAAISGFGVSQASPTISNHYGSQRVSPSNGTGLVSMSSRSCALQRKGAVQTVVELRARGNSGNVKDSRVRVRGENFKVAARSPETAASESISMDDFSSVEELKAALINSLEGVMPHVRRLEQGHFWSSECSQGRNCKSAATS